MSIKARITTLDPSEIMYRLPMGITLDDLEGSKIKVILFDVKYAKNGKNYDIGPMGFTSDNPDRLKVNVTNGPVTAIGVWGYTPVRITGVLVKITITKINFYRASSYASAVLGLGGLGLGERRELPQWCPGRGPGRQCIFGIFEAHRTAHKSSTFRKRSLNRSIRGHGH